MNSMWIVLRVIQSQNGTFCCWCSSELIEDKRLSLIESNLKQFTPASSEELKCPVFLNKREIPNTQEYSPQIQMTPAPFISKPVHCEDCLFVLK